MQLGAFIEGLQIIAKYEEADAYTIRAEHDQIWVASVDLPMSGEDKTRMEEIGWFADEGVDGWSAFM